MYSVPACSPNQPPPGITWATWVLALSGGGGVARAFLPHQLLTSFSASLCAGMISFCLLLALTRIEQHIVFHRTTPVVLSIATLILISSSIPLASMSMILSTMLQTGLLGCGVGLLGAALLWTQQTAYRETPCSRSRDVLVQWGIAGFWLLSGNYMHMIGTALGWWLAGGSPAAALAAPLCGFMAELCYGMIGATVPAWVTVK